MPACTKAAAAAIALGAPAHLPSAFGAAAAAAGAATLCAGAATKGHAGDSARGAPVDSAKGERSKGLRFVWVGRRWHRAVHGTSTQTSCIGKKKPAQRGKKNHV